MPLSKYTTTQLLEEIARRSLAGKNDITDFCENCGHFVPNPNAGTRYNPCDLGHVMEFKAPDDYMDIDLNKYGFYRLICSDRM